MIDTAAFSAELRAKSIDLDGRRLLVSRLAGSEQEPDLSEPVNCRGLGRLRHFGRQTPAPWPDNPLPSAPAGKCLPADSDAPAQELLAQVFQNAACNWRCWYCYVPFNLLGAHTGTSEWVTADELVDLWQAESNAARVLDLSGGQPDIVPEWVPWTMRALSERGISESTYLWSDDNLSTDYLWRYLPDDDIALLGTYKNYGRAVCFKGFDEDSFVLNTAAAPANFSQQFEIARRLLDVGIDMYAYVTLTTTTAESDIPRLVTRFVDRLQNVHENLPLRTVPLRVETYGPVEGRMRPDHVIALQRQVTAVEAWNSEIEGRFSLDARALSITEVPVGSP